MRGLHPGGQGAVGGGGVMPVDQGLALCAGKDFDAGMAAVEQVGAAEDGGDQVRDAEGGGRLADHGALALLGRIERHAGAVHGRQHQEARLPARILRQGQQFGGGRLAAVARGDARHLLPGRVAGVQAQQLGIALQRFDIVDHVVAVALRRRLAVVAVVVALGDHESGIGLAHGVFIAGAVAHGRARGDS